MTRKYILMMTGEREKIAERLKDLKSEEEEPPERLPSLCPRRDIKT